jgi:small subunit ribosomal protein S15
MAEEKTDTSEKTEKMNWVKAKPEEIEKIVVELAQKGDSPAKIGLILRDKYGIPKAKLMGKKITKILKDKKVTIKTESIQTQEKIDKLKVHTVKNKHDHTASRAITKHLWAMHRLQNN